MQATGMINAGGKLSRMGTNKALLTINRETVLISYLDEYQAAVPNIYCQLYSLFAAYRKKAIEIAKKKAEIEQ